MHNPYSAKLKHTFEAWGYMLDAQIWLQNVRSTLSNSEARKIFLYASAFYASHFMLANFLLVTVFGTLCFVGQQFEWHLIAFSTGAIVTANALFFSVLAVKACWAIQKGISPSAWWLEFYDHHFGQQGKSQIYLELLNQNNGNIDETQTQIWRPTVDQFIKQGLSPFNPDNAASWRKPPHFFRWFYLLAALNLGAQIGSELKPEWSLWSYSKEILSSFLPQFNFLMPLPLKMSAIYPAYTKLPAQDWELSLPGSLKVIYGTQLVLKTQKSEKIEQITVEFVADQSSKQNQPTFALSEVEGQPHVLESRLVLFESGTFRLKSKFKNGLDATTYLPTHFEVFRDSLPKLKAKLLTSNNTFGEFEKITFEVQIEDDFGYDKLDLQYLIQNKLKTNSLNLKKLYEPKKEATETVTLDLSETEISQGDTVKVTFEATDQDDISGPNVGASNEIVIEIESQEKQHLELLKSLTDIFKEAVALLDISVQKKPFDVEETQLKKIETILQKLLTQLLEDSYADDFVVQSLRNVLQLLNKFIAQDFVSIKEHGDEPEWRTKNINFSEALVMNLDEILQRWREFDQNNRTYNFLEGFRDILLNYQKYKANGSSKDFENLTESVSQFKQRYLQMAKEYQKMFSGIGAELDTHKLNEDTREIMGKLAQLEQMFGEESSNETFEKVFNELFVKFIEVTQNLEETYRTKLNERFQKEFENLHKVQEMSNETANIQQSQMNEIKRSYHQQIDGVKWDESKSQQALKNQEDINQRIQNITKFLEQTHFDPSFDIKKTVESTQRAKEFSKQSQTSMSQQQSVADSLYAQSAVIYELRKTEKQAQKQIENLKEMIEKGAKGRQKRQGMDRFKTNGGKINMPNNGQFEVNERYRGSILKMLQQVPRENLSKEQIEYYRSITQ